MVISYVEIRIFCCFLRKFVNSLHSLHRYPNIQIINTHLVQWRCNLHYTHCTKTLLIHKLLNDWCNECNVFDILLKTTVFLLFCIYIFRYVDKIFTFEEIIFLLERCIVKKKTYLCECPAGEMARHIRKRFLLYPENKIANFKERDRDNSNAHSV